MKILLVPLCHHTGFKASLVLIFELTVLLYERINV